MNLDTATLADLTEALDAGTVSSAELVVAYQGRIDSFDRGGVALGAVRCLDPTATEQAARADCARRQGHQGALLGVPVLVKDNIDVAGLPTTAGSLALAGWRRTSDAAVVDSLRRSGAVVLGKTNLTEWANFMAHDMPGGYSAIGGQVRNPYGAGLSPSGSSSGSAVAVAAGLAPLALGTETIGSILSPANACSVVGLKPTVGVVDRRGVVPLASSYDTVGPLAATVSGAASAFSALRGDVRPLQLSRGALQGARLGIAQTASPDGAGARWEAVAAALADLGATLVPVTLTTRFEGFSVLAYEFRRDIDHYLSRLPPSAPVHSLADLVEFNQAHGDQELRYGQSRLLQCLELDPEDPLELGRYRTALLGDLTLARRRIDSLFAEQRIEAVVFPAEGSCGIGARAGYPSVSVPAGYYGNGGRPFGVTVLGSAGREDRLLALAFDLDAALCSRRPPRRA